MYADLGSEMAKLGSEMTKLGSEMAELGSEMAELGSETVTFLRSIWHSKTHAFRDTHEMAFKNLKIHKFFFKLRVFLCINRGFFK